MKKQLVNILFPSHCLACGSKLYLLDTIQTLLWRFVAHIFTIASCCTNTDYLSTKDVLLMEGILLFWVPLWETEAEMSQ